MFRKRDVNFFNGTDCNVIGRKLDGTFLVNQDSAGLFQVEGTVCDMIVSMDIV